MMAEKRRQAEHGEQEESVLGQLWGLAESDAYPCHMPGHKRRLARLLEEAGLWGTEQQTLAAAAALDITEIDGFDNLHEPEGLLARATERAAALYGADHCYYSVNGSTAGLLTAISAAVPEGGKLILARNCHRAVYHAIYLRRLTPVYLYPATVPGTELADGITAEQVREALLQHPDAAAVLLTSPTYDGICADIEAIAELVHGHSIPLLVDGAHGAHFGFHPGFPASPVTQGADVTVVSLHKTMPCMTQTALLLTRGSRVDAGRLRLFEGMYQTSSPSYFLMAGMDLCVRLAAKQGAALWDRFFADRASFLEKAAGFKHVRVLTGTVEMSSDLTKTGYNHTFLIEPGKILIETSKTGLTGRQFYAILLEQYHLQMEMAAGNYVTAIMTCCDDTEGWQRLYCALAEIDREYAAAFGHCPAENSGQLPYPSLEQGVSLAKALDMPKRRVPLGSAQGELSGVFVNLYPPGIPIVVPGERLSAEAIELILRYRQQNLPLVGVEEDAITILN